MADNPTAEDVLALIKRLDEHEFYVLMSRLGLTRLVEEVEHLRECERKLKSQKPVPRNQARDRFILEQRDAGKSWQEIKFALADAGFTDANGKPYQLDAVKKAGARAMKMDRVCRDLALYYHLLPEYRGDTRNALAQIDPGNILLKEPEPPEVKQYFNMRSRDIRLLSQENHKEGGT